MLEVIERWLATPDGGGSRVAIVRGGPGIGAPRSSRSVMLQRMSRLGGSV